jgi:hypothetical protein
MQVRDREHCARVALSAFSEIRQIGGGCAGGLTWPCNALTQRDCGGTSTTGERTTGAGNIAATKLRHLKAHATELLLSSGAGQHGMSAGLAIAISIGFVEMVDPPVAGTTATEIATTTVRIVRAVSMTTDYLAIQTAGQPQRGWIIAIVTNL